MRSPKMKFFVPLLGMLVAITAAKTDVCSPIKVGCYKHDDSYDDILYSDRPTHDDQEFRSKMKIDFMHFEDYLEKALCRCETAAAEKGYPYYALRRYGECHGIKDFKHSSAKESIFCLTHNYEQCAVHHKKCFGSDDGQFIYEVTMQKKHDIKDPKELITDVFCQYRGKRTIQCPRDHIIDIESAFYGRLSKEHCGYKEHYDTNCRATTSQQRIRNECNHKNKCTLFPDDSVYGNPCGNTWKYIEIQYSCVHHKEHEKLLKAVFCEHAGERSIQCPGGQVLEVQSAFFGRLSEDYCTYQKGYNTDCVAGTSEQRIETKCSGKSICHLNPHVDVYGEPCAGTRKYIQVKYYCVEAFHLAKLTQGVFCQHKEPHRIKCPENSVLDVKSGFYGRLDKWYCGYRNNYDVDCVSTVSQHKIKVACNGENECTLDPNDAVFGNPCSGTTKYIKINYSCEPKHA